MPKLREWSATEQDWIRAEIERLRPWLFAFDFGGGLTTEQGIDPRRKFLVILKFAPKSLEGKSCLDIGCNNGQLGMMLKDRGAARVVGVDHNDTVVQQAKFLHGLFGYDIETYQMDVQELPGELGSFDYVFCLGVLYHLRDMCGMMDRLVELTKDVCFIESEVLAPGSDPHSAIFIEDEYRDDPSNWWIPGVQCVLSIARSSGFGDAHLIDYSVRKGSYYTREGLRNQARGAFRATRAREDMVPPRLKLSDS